MRVQMDHSATRRALRKSLHACVEVAVVTVWSRELRNLARFSSAFLHPAKCERRFKEGDVALLVLLVIVF